MRRQQLALALTGVFLTGVATLATTAVADPDVKGALGASSATTSTSVDTAPGTSAAVSASADTAAKAPAPAGVIHRDPTGRKGISPFWETLKKGDDAVAARDLDGAKAAYQDALRLDAHSSIVHYRLGEIELLKGNMKDAEADWDSALRFAAENPSEKGKALFVLADAKERQKQFEEETNRWNAYEALVKASPKAPALFPDTAADRKKRIVDKAQLETDYGAVKERIKKRLEAAEKSAADSAQSPRNR
jgi:tetratricopeptide (TPR) repeat protein